MKDIPLKPVTMKTINRFPALYKIQAQQAIRYEVNDAINITADSFIMASLLVLIEEFGWGTNKRATRIDRFLRKLQEVIDTNADYYEDAVAEGLRSKLHNHGVEYKMR